MLDVVSVWLLSLSEISLREIKMQFFRDFVSLWVKATFRARFWICVAISTTWKKIVVLIPIRLLHSDWRDSEPAAEAM